MTDKEALALALEALECLKKDFDADQFEWEISDVAITAIKQARALDKKAENARELGLDYEPVQQPFCFYYVENGEEYFAPKGAYVPDNAQPLYTTPPVQPAVPDAFGTREGEHPQYVQGWNDCRAEMLRIRGKT